MEEEISLRELIEILLSGKWIIIGVTVVAVLLAALISFFVLPDKYVATATIKVTAQDYNPPINNDVDAIIRNLTSAQKLSIDAYKDQVSNPAVLKETVEELKLKPAEYSINSLNKMISAEVNKDQNMITIKVEGTDPKDVTVIANSVAENFIEHISENTTLQLDDALEFIGTEISEQEKELVQAVEEYQEFLAQPGGVSELESETNAKLELLSDFKNQLTISKVEIAQTKAALKQVENDLVNTPPTLVTEKALADDAYLYEAAKDTSAKDFSKIKVQSEEINPVHTKLTTEKFKLNNKLAGQYAKEKALKVQIAAVQRELEQLQANLVEKQMQSDKYVDKVELLKNNYKLFNQRYEETKLNQATQSDEKNLTLLSSATEPQLPAGPNRLFNVAIAGVLGIMLSTFIVFFRDYWRKSALTK